MKRCRHYPEILFFVQVIVLCLVILISLVNLILQQDSCCIWSSLLGSSLGYLLPHPQIKKNIKIDSDNMDTQTSE